MAGFCIPKEDVQRFLQSLKDGTIDPLKLAEMSSAERRAVFEPIVGKDAAMETNRLFEQKILTKNIQETAVNWAKTVAGLKPALRQDLVGKIERLDERILDPKEEQAFLQDLAAQKLGVNLTFDEVKTVSELANKMKDLEEYKGDYANNEKRLDYGRAVTALQNYIADRKLASNNSILDDLRNNKANLPGRFVRGIASNAKAIQASMDDSAIFRQGWKVLWTNPTIWAKNALNSFKHLVTYTNQHQVLDELNADIVSRPTYDLMRRAKLDVGVHEEVFPTTLPEKIPLLGRVYKATENAYTAFVRKTRADVFDKMIGIAKANDVDLNDKELQSIGKMVNSLTGRGHLGKLEGIGSTVNTFFFSPKNLKSHLDVLTQPLTGAGGSKFVRKQAAKNLIKIVAGTGAILAIAKMIAPKSVELDPRSSDFGKIKVDNTRFDVTGGMSSLWVLMARIASATTKMAYDQSGGKIGANMDSYKSTTTGETRDLTNPKFGQSSLEDTVVDFFANKMSPAMNMIKDFYKGETFEGKKPTVTGEVVNLFRPLPVATLQDLLRDPKAQKDPRFVAFATVMDMLGIGTSTYTPRAKGAKPNDLTLDDILKAGQSYLPK